MKKEELRIGNWVGINHSINDEKAKDFQITGYHLINFQTNLHGVIITELILFKFGFEKVDRKWRDGSVSQDLFIKNKGAYDYYLTFTKDGIVLFRVGKNGLHIQEYIKEVTYIHQLQNLYFVLTDEELTLI